MYLWRRSASQKWWRDNEISLRAHAGDELAVIERPDRERLQLEVASKSQAVLQELKKQFGGRIQKLPRDWLKRSLRRKTKPIKIGSRKLIIPAGAAFGTGEHATTAMCLQMLERAMHFWGMPAPRRLANAPSRSQTVFRNPFRRGAENASRTGICTRGRQLSPKLVVDLGTGSGILALAAKLLGAKRVIGIDNDPIAMRTANQNARLNKIRGVQFLALDVRRWRLPSHVDIVTANLFSELLISILPRLKDARWLILSGILRGQACDFTRALRQNKIDLIEARRRGKWVAVLAACR
jgi:ribosomal protein L11 methyltransferase